MARSAVAGCQEYAVAQVEVLFFAILLLQIKSSCFFRAGIEYVVKRKQVWPIFKPVNQLPLKGKGISAEKGPENIARTLFNRVDKYLIRKFVLR